MESLAVSNTHGKICHGSKNWHRENGHAKESSMSLSRWRPGAESVARQTLHLVSASLNCCPVAETDPYGQMTAEQRLRFALWLQEAEKQNTRVLKELMVEHGPIRYRDENETE